MATAQAAQAAQATRAGRAVRAGRPAHGGARDGGWADGPDTALIRLCDLAGRPRGTGFLADCDGTMVTSHEAVDGLARLVLHAPGGQVCLVEASAVTPLPELGLALVATEGLDLPALPVAPCGPAHPEGRVRLPGLTRPSGARVTGASAATYAATDRFHLIGEVYELALDGAESDPAGAHAAGPRGSGAPVLDAATGAVLGVVATALYAGHRAGGFAVPVRPRGAPAPLADLLARNAATVPAYGPHLNLAGALRLTGAAPGSAAGGSPCRELVARPHVADALADFLLSGGEGAPLVLGLVGEPGSGRSTELAALAACRAEGDRPAPTLRLRGADLRPGDGGIKDAVERALCAAARTVGATGALYDAPPTGPARPESAADGVARLGRAAGRPLLVLLDAPEELPPVLAHALPEWAAGTARWLRSSRTRLVVAARPEFWEQAGAAFPPDVLYAASDTDGGRPLPPSVRLGDLRPREAEAARARHGLPADALPAADAAHPLALRLLSEVRAALGSEEPEEAGDPPRREEVFSAHLDLVCLRIAQRVAAGSEPPVRGSAVRRLAARTAGRVHEAARRCLGPGQGELGREAFEELFPWRTGWASAVLGEGLLVPAGAGYRFAHEEVGDWLQSLHLDLPSALDALVHRWCVPTAYPPSRLVLPATPTRPCGCPECPTAVPAAERCTACTAVPGGVVRGGPTAVAGADGREAPVRLPTRSGKRAGQPPPVPPAPPVAPTGYPRSLPVPRHRAGPVVRALLHAPPGVLAGHLMALVEALDEGPVVRPGRTWSPPRPGPVPSVPPPPAAADQDAPDTLDTDTVPTPRTGRAAGPRAGAPAAGVPAGEPYGSAARREEAGWWAAHLLREALLGVADAAPYREVLRALAGRIVVRSVAAGGFVPQRQRLGGLGEFGPWFWRRVPLGAPDRLDLLRLLLPADGPPPGSGERFLSPVAEILRADPAGTLPVVCGWFDDDRPLQAAPDGPRLTVASAAQALLHTHRRLAVDDLAEALVAAAHPAADAVLTALAEDEPSAVCRAVDRWAHDPRPERHVAAATYGARTAPFVRSRADRELLRYAALATLARPGERSLHGSALGLLVHDPRTRARYLPAALEAFAAGEPGPPPGAMAAALATDAEAVLAAFRDRLRAAPDTAAGPVPSARSRAEDALAELAAVTEPALARRVGALVEDHLRACPQSAPAVARYLDLRLEQGRAARPALLALTEALLRDHPAAVRCVLAPVLVAPGSPPSRPLRQELLDTVLDAERDLDVLDALLTAAAEGATARHPLLTRDLVHRLALLLGRTPHGAARFDRRTVALAGAYPAFARLLRGWLTDTHPWDVLLGPSAHRNLAAVPRPTPPPRPATSPSRP